MSGSYDAWLSSDFYICPVCKKQFYIPPYITDWRYKVNNKSGYKIPVCSYSCLNKATASKRNTLKGEHYMKKQYKEAGKK